LKLFLYNLENFFLTGPEISISNRKPEEKIKEISEIILKQAPDIALLLEIGGIDSLYNFNSKYLNSNYTPYILPGNSDRGIEMGYLVNKNLKYSFEIISHKNRMISNPNEFVFGKNPLKFSRDIAELRIIENDQVKLIIFLIHLKSKWDRDGNDPGGLLRRKAELNSVVELYLNYQKINPQIPVILSGDFNGTAQKANFEQEFESIFGQTDLIDCLDLLDLSSSDKDTYYQFTREGKRTGFQLDYIFLPKSLQSKVLKEKTGVYRYRTNSEGANIPPISSYERQTFPSDHYPLILDLDFLK
jgi:endonuclease/exonuclease/phosphatase family metal-dependent hydrolase